MRFLDSLRKFYGEFQQSLAEERAKMQVKALTESDPTDEFVTMTISGDGELEKMTRAGWDLVRKTNGDEQAFFNTYLARKRRDDLARSPGRPISTPPGSR